MDSQVDLSIKYEIVRDGGYFSVTAIGIDFAMNAEPQKRLLRNLIKKEETDKPIEISRRKTSCGHKKSIWCGKNFAYHSQEGLCRIDGYSFRF